jgi:hypothetical protein
MIVWTCLKFAQCKHVPSTSGTYAVAAEVDDLSVSNNHDTQKVLAIVAKMVIDFLRQYPKSSSPAAFQ